MVWQTIFNKVHLHKVDIDIDIKRDIQQRIGDELADVGLLDIPIEYHMTSIFDHSIFEAFSKIIQKLIPQLHTLQDLLNNLVDVRSLCIRANEDHGHYEGVPVWCD